MFIHGMIKKMTALYWSAVCGNCTTTAKEAAPTKRGDYDQVIKTFPPSMA